MPAPVGVGPSRICIAVVGDALKRLTIWLMRTLLLTVNTTAGTMNAVVARMLPAQRKMPPTAPRQRMTARSSLLRSWSLYFAVWAKEAQNW